MIRSRGHVAHEGLTSRVLTAMTSIPSSTSWAGSLASPNRSIGPSSRSRNPTSVDCHTSFSTGLGITSVTLRNLWVTSKRLSPLLSRLRDDLEYFTACKKNASVLPWLRSRADKAGKEGTEET